MIAKKFSRPALVFWPFLILLNLVLVHCKSVDLPPLTAEVPQERLAVDFAQVQTLVNARCLACHSCLESPCQLNMQTWDGFRRGAFHQNVYDGERSTSVAPTRMFEDSFGEPQWRERGFVDVLSGGDDSILISTLRMTQLRKEPPSTPVRQSNLCPLDGAAVTASTRKADELAMPYGLPALSHDEQKLLSDWVAGGAPGQTSLPLTTKTLPDPDQDQIQQWTNFLNAPDLNSRLVARYLYEHLFLAHLYFKDSPRDFLRLVRSSTACDQGLNIIGTRRPNDDPGVQKWYYCFYRDPAVVVYKNHLPYELSAQKLNWLKKNFSQPQWQAQSFPSFHPDIAGNPLLAFGQIPVLARSRFLLADADYEVMTFIKGPVCNGSFAVNSIQDQFYVFFTDPQSDMMVVDPAYAEEVSDQLILPGSLGTNLSTGRVLSAYRDILAKRGLARADLALHLAKNFPQGLALNQIWDGDGVNDNAVLTVFRHDDNAKVVKGARGDISKTVFVLDYSTFERLVYNLAINFDVFDNVSHQLLTRLYMDILRMDAEDNFLQFLPPAERLRTKEQWYQGLFTNWKLSLLDEKKWADIPAQIHFAPDRDAKLQLVQKILFERLTPNVRGADDTLNWKTLKETKTTDESEIQLRRLTSIPAVTPLLFPRFFPEVSVLVVREADGVSHIYSILHNREHQNISWILNEEDRLQPSEDTLTILPGVLGAYPNQFLVVEKNQLHSMVEQILSIQDKKDEKAFTRRYAIDRMDPVMWRLSDELNDSLLKQEPIEAGILDLSRYVITAP